MNKTVVTPAREGDRVFLPGVEDRNWGVGAVHQHSLAAACAAAMTLIGESEADYPTIMTLSGEAMAFRVPESSWSPHSSYSLPTSAPAHAILDVLPWQTRAISVTDPQAEVVVRRAIDDGRPTLLLAEEVDLITGYDSVGFLGRAYANPRSGYASLAPTSGEYRIFTEPVAPVNALERLQAAVESAGRVWNLTEPVDGYLMGRAAYSVWAERIREEAIEKMLPQDRPGAQYANAFLVECLIDSRSALRQYLLRIMPDIETRLGERLEAATDCLGRFVLAFTDHPERIAPYPYQSAEWTREHRMLQQRRLIVAEAWDCLARERLREAIPLMTPR